MLAYKTFAQCPIEQRPPGIDLSVPWQQQRILNSEASAFAALGWTVVSEFSDVQNVQIQSMPDVSLKGNSEVVPRTVKNEHTMQPFGAKKDEFISSDHGFAIILSNKSEDGLTFNYDFVSGVDQTVITDFVSGAYNVPRVGDYIFQKNFCKRSWVTSVDHASKTIHLDSETVKPTLDNGVSHYSKGFWVSVDVPDWFNPIYLWGLAAKGYWTNGHDGKNDFVELSIVDSNNFFKSDSFCASMFGAYGITDSVEAGYLLLSLGWDLNGEYGHWTKYYDEAYVVNIDGKGAIMTPDGAPGVLIPHLECRISVFTTRQDDTLNEYLLDYYATAKV